MLLVESGGKKGQLQIVIIANYRHSEESTFYMKLSNK